MSQENGNNDIIEISDTESVAESDVVTEVADSETELLPDREEFESNGE